jgi:hypothetical protein
VDSYGCAWVCLFIRLDFSLGSCPTMSRDQGGTGLFLSALHVRVTGACSAWARPADENSYEDLRQQFPTLFLYRAVGSSEVLMIQSEDGPAPHEAGSPVSVAAETRVDAIAALLNHRINTYRRLTLTIDASGTVNPAAGSCGTATPLANLLGFETTQYWTSPQAPLSVTGTRKTQGCFGLQVGGSGYRTINSAPFVTPLSGVTSTIGIDVFIPASQPNPSWLGAVQLYLTCPSAGVYNAYAGQVELTGKPQGAFSTASFTVPPSLVSVLNTAHNDCSFSVAVNMNQTPEPPVLDKLRFM